MRCLIVYNKYTKYEVSIFNRSKDSEEVPKSHTGMMTMCP